MSKKLFSIVSILSMLAMLLSACGTAATTAATVAATVAPATTAATVAPATAVSTTTAAAAPVIPAQYMVNQPQAFYADWVKTIGGEDFLFSPVKSKVTVGILSVGNEMEYQQVRDTAGKAIASQMGINLILDSFESDVATQRTKSEDFVTRGVKCEISTSRDDASWISLGTYLNQNNVLFYGEGGTANSLTRAQLPNYIGYVGMSNYMNNYNGGVWAATYFTKTYPNEVPTMAVGNYPSAPVGHERADGFIAGFQSVRPDLVIAFNDGLGTLNSGRADVLPFIENLFTSKKFNIFYSIWDEPAMAALTAAQARGLTPKDLMIVGHDGTTETAKIIAQGNSMMVADIGQNPSLAGKVTTAICGKLLDGELQMSQVPVFLYIPGFLITSDTAAQFLAQSAK